MLSSQDLLLAVTAIRSPGMDVAMDTRWLGCHRWQRVDAERTGNSQGNERRIIRRDQLAPRDACNEVLGDIPGDGQGQPGLADPSRSGQG